QALARAEVVAQHAVARAERAGEPAQAEIADPVLGDVLHRAREQPLAGPRPVRRTGHRGDASARAYHVVHVPLGTPLPSSQEPPAMARQRIEHRATTTADPATVYALLREGATWPEWAPIDSFELEREGAGEPEGVGAVRVLRSGRVTGRDTVAELVENRRFAYTNE